MIRTAVSTCVHAKQLQSCLTLLQPYGLQPIRLLCPWDSPVKDAGMGCHALLQGIFLTQGSSLRLLCLLHGHQHLLGSPCLPKGTVITGAEAQLGGGEGKGFLCVWDRLELEGPLHDKNVIMPSHFFQSYVIEANMSTNSFHFHQCCSSLPSLP